MVLLLLLHFLEEEWETQGLALSVHVGFLHEFEGFLGEDCGQLCDISIAAPVSVVYAILVLHVVVFLGGDDSEVRVGVLVDAEGHLGLEETAEVVRVLHVLLDNALLHLADVLLLDDAHQVGESAVDGILFEAVTLLDTFSHEALAALF